MLRNPKVEHQRKVSNLEETFSHIGIDMQETENIFGFLGLEEAEMSPDEAMKILGLTGEMVGDPNAIKKAYRDASREHHPDLGGDAEMMKKVNAAYEVLKGGGVGGGFKSSVDRDAIDRENKKNEAFVKDYLKQEVKVDDFLSHLKQWEPNLEVSTSLFPEGEKRSDWGSYYAGMNVNFKTPSGERSLGIQFIVSLSDLRKTPSLGANEMVTIPMRVVTSVYVDGKKQKIKQMDYTFTSDKSVIVDPESVFPAARMSKIFSGQARKGSKFARRDMEAAVRSELDARVQGSEPYVHIPIGEDQEGNPLEMVVYRTVFMRQPGWSTMGVWRRTGKFQISRMIRESVLSVSYSESYETVKRWKEIQQKAKAAPPEQKISVVMQEQKKDKEDSLKATSEERALESVDSGTTKVDLPKICKVCPYAFIVQTSPDSFDRRGGFVKGEHKAICRHKDSYQDRRNLELRIIDLNKEPPHWCPLRRKSKAESVDSKKKLDEASFKYGMRLRPAGPGAVKPGYTSYDPTFKLIDRDPVIRHGAVEYDHELSDEEIAKWELVPIGNKGYLDRYFDKVWNKVGKYAHKYLELGDDALREQILLFVDKFGPIHPVELEDVIKRVEQKSRGMNESIAKENLSLCDLINLTSRDPHKVANLKFIVNAIREHALICKDPGCEKCHRHKERLMREIQSDFSSFRMDVEEAMPEGIIFDDVIFQKISFVWVGR